MSTKLWGGRFTKTTDEMINEFQASISFDKRMYHEDIAGSIAHATMLAKCGIIAEADRDAIVGGLKEILASIESGEFSFDIALAPEFTAEISSADTIDYYTIEVSDELIDQQVKMYTQRAAKYDKVEQYEELK